MFRRSTTAAGGSRSSISGGSRRRRLPSCLRIGIGFNTSPAGRDPDRDAGQERVLEYFERFQQTVSRAWKNELARWMAASAGVDRARRESARNSRCFLPTPSIVCWRASNAAALEWIFVGRWLHLDRPDDAAILRDRAKLARAIDDTFRALLPIWLATYEGAA